MMKHETYEIKTASVASHAKAGQPFFSKKGADSFFGKSDSEPSFFNSNKNHSEIGNGIIQTKLAISQPEDKYEKEADTMADKVVQRMENPFIQPKCANCEEEEKKQNPVQRKCAACEKEEEQKLQPKSESSSPSSVPAQIESSLNASKGNGNPLPEKTRAQMENSFGSNFSNVRLHTDNEAVQLNKDLHAQAFTHGNDIYFNSGKFNSESLSGKHLLAHELTHVVQQGHGIIRRDKEGKPAKAEKPSKDEQAGKPGKATKAAKSPKLAIAVNWTLKFPKIPAPDFSESMETMNAWELAIINASPAYSTQIESKNPKKDNSSFLKEITIDIVPLPIYKIAKELNDIKLNGEADKPVKGLPTLGSDLEYNKKCFQQIIRIINTHALEHFARYEVVINSFQADFTKAIQGLPSAKKPVGMTKSELEVYTRDFVIYQMSLLNYKLWEDACAWEKMDYPKLLERSTCLKGRLPDSCQKAPKVMTPPLLIEGK